MHIPHFRLFPVLFGLLYTIFCSPINTPSTHSIANANLPSPFTLIPSDFQIRKYYDLPFRFPPEACYINMIAPLVDAAHGDFNSDIPATNYRSTQFRQPVISIMSHDDKPIPRKFVVWGIFLISYYLRTHDAFQTSLYILSWQGKDVGAIGTGNGKSEGSVFPLGLPNTATAAATTVTTTNPSNENIDIEYAYFGTRDLGKNAVFMTIISALQELAPQPKFAVIEKTWINFLKSEDCLFTVVPIGTGAGVFTYSDLILTLSKTAAFFAAQGRYQQLAMNISAGGVQLAQAALVYRLGSGEVGSGGQGVGVA
ncbi:MAG: hypothetical protein L6R41_006961 [Letrouitia leprolyta]|nr:MAG: hypothetical protein L6R41_006961 [Letrouitia leprolyta]